MKLGENILKLRKQNGLSQEQLGEKVNVTRQTISNWELNETTPNPEQLKLLSKALNVSIDELLDNDVKNVVIEKVSNTERLAGIIIKILKVFAVLGIIYVILIVLGIILFKVFPNEKVTTVNEIKSATLNCSIEDNNYTYELLSHFPIDDQTLYMVCENPSVLVVDGDENIILKRSDVISINLAELRGRLSPGEANALLEELGSKVPAAIEEVIGQKEKIRLLAGEFLQCPSVFFIGRGLDCLLASEGSLKLKEITYIHSEAYAAGEMKHGTISLITDGTPVIALATDKKLFEKTLSNIKEVKARGADVIGIATESHKAALAALVDSALSIPDIHPMFLPSLEVIPMQLFAYYVALMRGCDIDKPRNLAKSVTVE